MPLYITGVLLLLVKSWLCKPACVYMKVIYFLSSQSGTIIIAFIQLAM